MLMSKLQNIEQMCHFKGQQCEQINISVIFFDFGL